jgi:hypothetical protein
MRWGKLMQLRVALLLSWSNGCRWWRVQLALPAIVRRKR